MVSHVWSRPLARMPPMSDTSTPSAAGASAAASESPAAPHPELPAGPRSSTATSLPHQFSADHLAQRFDEFTREYAPVGPGETTLVAALARHAVAAEQWSAGWGAIVRQRARELPAYL